MNSKIIKLKTYLKNSGFDNESAYLDNLIKNSSQDCSKYFGEFLLDNSEAESNIDQIVSFINNFFNNESIKFLYTSGLKELIIKIPLDHHEVKNYDLNKTYFEKFKSDFLSKFRKKFKKVNEDNQKCCLAINLKYYECEVFGDCATSVGDKKLIPSKTMISIHSKECRPIKIG